MKINKSRTGRTSRQAIVSNALIYAGLLGAAVIIIAPYLLSIMASFKTSKQLILQGPASLPDPFTLDNYLRLFSGRNSFVAPVVVTVQMVIVLVIGQMVCSILAAYAFAILKFPGRDALFWSFLTTLMIPGVVTVIPLYLMLSSWGLRDTFAGLVLPYLLGSPYAIFLLRQNFLRVPAELLDAVQLDGCGHLRALRHVVLPTNGPILATLLLITVVSQWNSFLWPLIISSSREWQVITVSTAYLQSQYESNWTLVLAATTLAMIPLVLIFVVFQKRIVQAIGVTGIR